MAQSLAQILVHFVFSTQNRDRLIDDVIRDDLHAYIGGIMENLKGTLLAAGSTENHIHLLVAHPRTASPSAVVELFKNPPAPPTKTRAESAQGDSRPRRVGPTGADQDPR